MEQPLKSTKPLSYRDKNFSFYTTKLGMIGERKGDKVELGDGLQRISLYGETGYYLGEDSREVFSVLQYHRRSPGVFVRSVANSGDDYDDPRITSRDQTRGLVRFAGLYANKGDERAQDLVRELTWGQIKKGIIFYWNTNDLDPEKREHKRSYTGDVANPEHISEYVRSNLWRSSLLPYLSYPFLIFADAWSIAGTLIKIMFKNNLHPDYADDDHRIGTILFQNEICPTPLAKINLWIYRRFRKVWVSWYINIQEIYRPRIPSVGGQYAVDRKYVSLSAPPFNERYRPIIEERMGRK
jgi:hypothetical protein